MTVSFKVAEQPSELKVYTSFFTLIAVMYLVFIIMNWSSNKQTYKLYFNFTCKLNFRVIINGKFIASYL